MLKNHSAAPLKELDMNMNDIIMAIANSISKDLMAILEPQAPLLLSGKRPTYYTPETTSPEVETFQIALNLIGNFA